MNKVRTATIAMGFSVFLSFTSVHAGEGYVVVSGNGVPMMALPGTPVMFYLSKESVVVKLKNDPESKIVTFGTEEEARAFIEKEGLNAFTQVFRKDVIMEMISGERNDN